MTASSETTTAYLDGEEITSNGTGTALEPYRVGRVVAASDYEREIVDGWVAKAAPVFKLAEYIAPTEFVPRTMRNNPAAVAACILSGRELGLGPMTSLRHVQVVEGSPSLSAEYKRARVLSRGHEFVIKELTTTRCTVVGRRRGVPPLEITFTIDDARRANLVKPRGAWETRPRRMLFARCTSEICDFMFSDCTNGLPTAELMMEGEYDELGPVDPGTETVAPGGPSPAQPRRAQRKTPAGSRQARAAEAPAAPRTEPPEPLLPGEEAPAADSPQPPEPSPGPDDPGPTESEMTADGGSFQGDGDRDPSKMVTKINALMGSAFGMKGRADKLRVVSALAGRRVESSKDLTYDECKAVIDALEEAAQAPAEGERAARLLAVVGAWEDSQRPAAEREAADEGEPPPG